MEWHIWLSVDMGLGRCGPAKAGLPWRCSRTFIPQTVHAQSPFHANRGKSWLFPAPLPLAGSPRGTAALGLWGCYGGVSTRPGVCQTPCRHVWDEGLCYPGNGTALIPGSRVDFLELQRPQTAQEIWVPSRSQGPAPWA